MEEHSAICSYNQIAGPFPGLIQTPQSLLSLFLKKHFLFLAVLGPPCSSWAFFSCGRQASHSAASLVAEHRLWAQGLQELQLAGSRAQAQGLWRTGLVAPWHVDSSLTGNQTRAACIGRQILNHWTKEVLFHHS